MPKLSELRPFQVRKRASKRRRSAAGSEAADEGPTPAPKRPATRRAKAEGLKSVEDVTTAVASTSKGAQPKEEKEYEQDVEVAEEEEVAEEAGSGDAQDGGYAEELIVDSRDNLSGLQDEEGEAEAAPEAADEAEEEAEAKEEEAADADTDAEAGADVEVDAGAEADADMLVAELGDDDESYDSHIEGDVQTNVAGDALAGDRVVVALQGVKFFDEDAATDTARSNINKLLRSRRYHDDDVSEPIERHAVGPRYAPHPLLLKSVAPVCLVYFPAHD